MTVVEALRDVPAHRVITDRDVREARVPVTQAATGRLSRAREVLGQAYRRPLVAGQRLRSAEVEQLDLASEIRPGYRAISVPADTMSLLSGLIQDDDFVDVVYRGRINVVLLPGSAIGPLAEDEVAYALEMDDNFGWAPIDFIDEFPPYPPVGLEGAELQVPFVRRVVVPMFRRLAVIIASRAPQRRFDQTKQKLEEAGNPGHIGAGESLGPRVILAVALGGVGMLLLVVSRSAIGSGFLLGMVFGGFGYVMPSIWLSRMAKNRKAEITKSLPDAIDLLTISVESGLGFDPALMRVAEKWDNALTREFGQALNELRLGNTKREALREMSDRVNVDDLRIFVSSSIQADQLSVSMSQVLRSQSDAMRVRRRQRAAELAHKGPIKMLFPMVFWIFPALNVIILGPAIPIAIRSFGN